MGETYQIFDRERIKARQSRRGAANGEQFYLFQEGAARLQERMLDFNRDFQDVLAFGPLIDEAFFPEAPKNLTLASKAGIDDEVLGLNEGQFDFVISNLQLHWVNDLPGALIQIRRALKPDGLFLAVMFGGETLNELRRSLMEAEIEVSGGASLRVSPFADVRDAGQLLQRAGFALPVSDLDKLTVSFEHPFQLMQDLKAMGENNALLERRKFFTGKQLFGRTADIYQEKYADDEGRIPATFQFLHLSGFAPGPNQPQPLKPGSGQVNLNDVFAKDKD